MSFYFTMYVLSVAKKMKVIIAKKFFIIFVESF